MKKYIFIALFLLPSVGFAQSVNDQYISALQQVLQLLMQEVAMLEQQLATLQQSTATVPIVATSTTQTAPVFGSTLQVNQPIVMNNSISVLVNGQSEITVPSGSHVSVSWDGKDAIACGLDFDSGEMGHQGGWSGNFGLSGEKQAGPFTATTTITLQCNVPITNTNPTGKATTTAIINVK